MPPLAIVSPLEIAKKPEDADGDDARHGFDRNDPPKEPMSYHLRSINHNIPVGAGF